MSGDFQDVLCVLRKNREVALGRPELDAMIVIQQEHGRRIARMFGAFSEVVIERITIGAIAVARSVRHTLFRDPGATTNRFAPRFMAVWTYLSV